MGPMTREDITVRLGEIGTRMAEINDEYAGTPFPEDTAREFKSLDDERSGLTKLDAELEFRTKRVLDAAGTPENRESGAGFHVQPPRAASRDIWDLEDKRARSRSDEEYTELCRDDAMRAVERMHFPHDEANREDAQGHIERLMSKFSDMTGDKQQFARHILQTGSPTYRRAFAKSISGAALTQEETRAMSLTAASGGYAVPVTLDPTIIPTVERRGEPVACDLARRADHREHVERRVQRRGRRFA